MLRNKAASLFYYDVVGVFFAGVALFTSIVCFAETDILMHGAKVLEVQQHQSSFPPNFLYYFIVDVLSAFTKLFFQTPLHAIFAASVVVLSMALAAKYAVTKYILIRFFPEATHRKMVIAASVAALFMFTLPDPYNIVTHKYYLGRLVPTVWHNSTTIFLFPVALLLFYKQYRMLEARQQLNTKQFLILLLLNVLNVLIKPSFFLISAPVTLLFLVKEHKLNKTFFINSLPIIITAAIVYVQEKLIYVYNTGSFDKGDSSVGLTKPFDAWSFWQPGWYIPIAILFSFLLPLAYAVLFRKAAIVNKTLAFYATALMAAGFLVCVFVAEEGPRKYHLNFFWQNIICVYILYVIIIIESLYRYWHDKHTVRHKILGALISLHVLSGLIYLVKIITKGYT